MGRFILINKKYSAGPWVVFTIQYLNKLEMESRSSGNVPLTKYQMFIGIIFLVKSGDPVQRCPCITHLQSQSTITK